MYKGKESLSFPLLLPRLASMCAKPRLRLSTEPIPVGVSQAEWETGERLWEPVLPMAHASRAQRTDAVHAHCGALEARAWLAVPCAELLAFACERRAEPTRSR
jgi:hypothetical protein